MYVWRDICSDSIDVLKSKLGPDSLPSNAVQCELSKPNKIHQLYRMFFSNNQEVEYFTASLVAGSKQYIEIMHASSSEAVLELEWKKPHSLVYKLISSQFLFPYHDNSYIEIVPETYHPPPSPMHIPSAQMILLMHPKDARNSIFSLPTADVNEVFPSCVYQPAYLSNSRRESNSLELVSIFPTTPPDSPVISISLVDDVGIRKGSVGSMILYFNFVLYLSCIL